MHPANKKAPLMPCITRFWTCKCRWDPT